MSRQDKATTERHAKALRELLKKPENKLCADCKRNDPRWASWNIGVFLCIRCSGIHRSMGTHISKVKSVDLDVWTPEQMASIQKWGNRLANLYWEAHLRPGHVPADHKMESFIRSKYESRRWAIEGPPPSDPSVLENQSASAPAPAPVPQISQVQSAAQPAASASRSSVTTRQPQPHQLLSSTVANRAQRTASQPTIPSPQTQQTPQPQAQPVPSAADELFSLDFHPRSGTPSNPQTTSPPPKKDVKQDILSLFSSPAPPVHAQAAFGQFAQTQPAWGQFESAPAQQPSHSHTTSMVGNAGVGMWGASSGWNATPAVSAQTNVWGAPMTQPVAQPVVQQQQSLFTTSDVWGGSNATTGNGGDLFASPLPGMQKKDDAFGDIWGGFK
ncbi:hypothetical protein AcW1_000088 [Taiwanofungus camphoratus]|nr:hypothetical protein AcW2_001419 [Antrodia cinnamomea]KAI0962823.1 hypothetical protein AcW1_000088 [Antrodia cinnamomea]